MRILRNSGSDRVVDLLRPALQPGTQLDIVTPDFSLFAFAELQQELSRIGGMRLVLPEGSEQAELLGCSADRGIDYRVAGLRASALPGSLRRLRFGTRQEPFRKAPQSCAIADLCQRKWCSGRSPSARRGSG